MKRKMNNARFAGKCKAITISLPVDKIVSGKKWAEDMGITFSLFISNAIKIYEKKLDDDDKFEKKYHLGKYKEAKKEIEKKIEIANYNWMDEN